MGGITGNPEVESRRAKRTRSRPRGPEARLWPVSGLPTIWELWRSCTIEMPSGAMARTAQIARNSLVMNPEGFFARIKLFRYPGGKETDSHFGNRGRNRLPRPRAGIRIVVDMPVAEVRES